LPRQIKTNNQKPILFCQIWEYGTTPTKNVQGQLKTQMGLSDQRNEYCAAGGFEKMGC
jgi:hypothetical protein